MFDLTRRKFLGLVAAILGTRKAAEALDAESGILPTRFAGYQEIHGLRWAVVEVSDFPTISPGLLGKPVPIYYGRISDEGQQYTRLTFRSGR